MFWLFKAARRLHQQGILGINRRNLEFIREHNPQRRFPIVDDKLRLHRLCDEIGVRSPKIYGVISSAGMLQRLDNMLAGLDDFVIKPNRGAGGRGIAVITGRDGDRFLRHNGEPLTREEIRRIILNTLSGMFSLGGDADAALLQQRVRLHPAFKPLSYKGIPDIRIILYRNEPAMAMLRLPTKQSNGRANLHQGGIGVGIDLQTGITSHAVLKNRVTEMHPDTGVPVIGMMTPYWPEVLELSRRVADAVGLGYLGVDIVIDAEDGPLLLEANARPGLAIQIANAKGLLPRLREIDREMRV